MFLSLARMVCYLVGACVVACSMYCVNTSGAQYGQSGVVYIVGGVLVGRGILPHVRQSSRRSASSKFVGGGG